MMDAPRRPRPGLAAGLATALVVAGLVGLALSDLSDLFTALAAILATCAVAAELVAARYSASLTVSAAFAAGPLSGRRTHLRGRHARGRLPRSRSGVRHPGALLSRRVGGRPLPLAGAAHQR